MAGSPPSLRVLQTNLQHSETATAQMRKWLEVSNSAIALIQEPWVRAGRIRGLFNLGGKLFVANDHEVPRTCIYVTKNINAQPLTEFCSRDIYAIRLQIPQSSSLTELVVASVYMHESDDPPPHDLTRLVNYCESNGLEILIGTDSNAHHTLWGMEKCNNRGLALVEYLFTTNLVLLNTGSEPTFVTRRSRTVIDLTLATEKVRHLVAGWHVSDEASCSDHRWIRYDIQVDIPPTPPRRNPRKTDKARYRRELGNRLSSITIPARLEDTEQINTYVKSITDILLQCYQAACPLTSPPEHPPGDRWWGPELQRLRKRVRRLLNWAMNTSTDQDWDSYKEAKSRYKKRIRFRRTASWRKFCGSIETFEQANRVRKILACDSGRELGSLKKPDNTYTSSTEKAQQVLLATHFPGCRLTEEVHWQDNVCTPTEDCWKHAHEVVTMDKLRWAINSFDPFKAAGPDGVFPALLQWGGEALLQPLLIILRACLAHRYIPVEWREVKVIFIPKPGRGDYTDAKSFRPISLTSFLLKALERLCERELREHTLKHMPMHDNQHAYTSGKSTESALHLVVSQIEETIRDKSICLGTFIDIEGAFDRTNFSSIGAALARHGASDIITGWVKNMLSKRTVRFAEGTSAAIVARGCPQGGVLSPLLWNLVINDLITQLNANHFYTIGYADDLAILIRGRTASLACDLTQAALRIVENWCRAYDLSVNPTKTM